MSGDIVDCGPGVTFLIKSSDHQVGVILDGPAGERATKLEKNTMEQNEESLWDNRTMPHGFVN